MTPLMFNYILHAVSSISGSPSNCNSRCLSCCINTTSSNQPPSIEKRSRGRPRKFNKLKRPSTSFFDIGVDTCDYAECQADCLELVIKKRCYRQVNEEKILHGSPVHMSPDCVELFDE